MRFAVRMGEPEVRDLWEDLARRKALSTLSSNEDEFLEKRVKCLKLLASNPRHPGLQTHEISDLTRKFKEKVFESYLENNVSGARRMFWAYGPKKGETTILQVNHHPNENQRSAYKRVKLSSFPAESDSQPKTGKRRGT